MGSPVYFGVPADESSVVALKHLVSRHANAATDTRHVHELEDCLRRLPLATREGVLARVDLWLPATFEET